MENNNPSETLTPHEQQSSTGVPVEVTPANSLSSTEADKAGENNIQKKYSEAWFQNIESKVKALQEEVNQTKGLQESTKEIKDGITEAREQIKTLKKNNDNLKQELIAIAKQNTKESLEILGIFISLFTFISVSASIVLQFKTVFHAAFVLMLFLIGLMTFLYLFHHLVHGEHRPLKKIYYLNRRFTWKIFLLHHWKTGTYSFLIPFFLAIILGGICLFFGAERDSSSKQLEPANINYIQNMPTSKIRLDENIEQCAIPTSAELPKTNTSNVSK